MAQEQHAGLLELGVRPSVASIRLSPGRSTDGLCPGAGAASSHLDTYDQDAERILVPGDGAAGDQGAQHRPACAAIVATRRLRPVPSQRFLAL